MKIKTTVTITYQMNVIDMIQAITKMDHYTHTKASNRILSISLHERLILIDTVYLYLAWFYVRSRFHTSRCSKQHESCSITFFAGEWNIFLSSLISRRDEDVPVTAHSISQRNGNPNRKSLILQDGMQFWLETDSHKNYILRSYEWYIQSENQNKNRWFKYFNLKRPKKTNMFTFCSPGCSGF